MNSLYHWWAFKDLEKTMTWTATAYRLYTPATAVMNMTPAFFCLKLLRHPIVVWNGSGIANQLEDLAVDDDSGGHATDKDGEGEPDGTDHGGEGDREDPLHDRDNGGEVCVLNRVCVCDVSGPFVGLVVGLFSEDKKQKTRMLYVYINDI